MLFNRVRILGHDFPVAVEEKIAHAHVLIHMHTRYLIEPLDPDLEITFVAINNDVHDRRRDHVHRHIRRHCHYDFHAAWLH